MVTLFQSAFTFDQRRKYWPELWRHTNIFGLILNNLTHKIGRFITQKIYSILLIRKHLNMFYGIIVSRKRSFTFWWSVKRDRCNVKVKVSSTMSILFLHIVITQQGKVKSMFVWLLRWLSKPREVILTRASLISLSIFLS